MAKKNSMPVMLPQILTIMKQPNRVTSAKYNYTLIQQKIFLLIMKNLQEHIDVQLSGKIKVYQLPLFQDDNKISIQIALKDIGVAPSHYTEVIDSLRQIKTIEIEFPFKDDTGKKYRKYGSLLSGVIVPEDKKYRKDIYIQLDKDVAQELLNISEGYTRFSYEVTFNAKSKYTPRIYQYICRWRDKGGHRIAYQEFREFLNIGDEYKDWKDFKKRIIKKVQAELTERADVWFEVEMERSGGTQYLVFKIMTTDNMIIVNKQKDNIMEMLKIHFGFAENDFKAISVYLLRPHIYQDLFQKLIALKEHFSNNRDIKNIPAYVTKSIVADFKHRV